MKTFTDNAGRVWTITVNVDAIKRVRGLLNVNLAAVGENNFKLLSDLLSDPVLLVDVLFVLCKAEADARSITDVQFGQSMAGDAITAAAEAMLEELTSFFPSAQGRAAMKALLDKGRQVSQLLLNHAMLQIDQLDPAQEAARWIDSSGSSPVSSGSTPAP